MNPVTYWRDWWRGLGVFEQTVALVALVAAITLILAIPAASEPVPVQVVQLFVPIDVVALTQAIFTGIAAVGGVFATIYSLLAASRAKRAEIAAAAAVAASASAATAISKVKDTVELVERNTNSLTTQIAAAARLAGLHEGEAKGVRAGEDIARTLAEGQKQGAETERASAQANSGLSTVMPSGTSPIPVADERTATAAERSATATERVATAAETKKE